MDVGKAFTFMFEDEQWVSKLLIAGLLGLLSVFIVPVFPLLGYLTELLQNVMRGAARPLPAWDNVGVKFTKGLNVFAISLVYALPLILLTCCFVAAAIVLGSAADGRNGDDGAAALISLLTICFISVVFVLGIAVSAVLPAATVQYASGERFADAFKFAEVAGFIRRNLGNYLLALLLTWVAGIIASVGFVACFVGIYFTNAWAQMVQYHILGQVYRSAATAPPAVAPAAPVL